MVYQVIYLRHNAPEKVLGYVTANNYRHALAMVRHNPKYYDYDPDQLNVKVAPEKVKVREPEQMMLKLGTRIGGEPMKKILEFPENRQTYDYDCGANSVLSVLQYYGYMGREDKLMALADTDEDGTSIDGIENVLKHFGVGYESKQGMTIAEIRDHVDNGFPTIISIQAYPDDNDKNLQTDIDDGHYVVVIGYDDKGVIMEDPSCCYRTYLTDEELIERWHDEDELRLGLVVFGVPKYKKDGIIPLKEYEMQARLARRNDMSRLLVIAENVAKRINAEMRESRIVEAIKFDTKKEIQVYKQEHDVTPGTKLQVRNQHEKEQRNKDKA